MNNKKRSYRRCTDCDKWYNANKGHDCPLKQEPVKQEYEEELITEEPMEEQEHQRTFSELFLEQATTKNEMVIKGSSLTYEQNAVMKMIDNGCRIRVMMSDDIIDSAFIDDKQGGLIHKSPATIQSLIDKGLIKLMVNMHGEIYYVKKNS